MGFFDRFLPRRTAEGVKDGVLLPESTGPAVVPVSHYGSCIGLRSEFEERYCILHRNVFPGVLERIRKCNIRNYTIFLAGETLFGHYEYIGRAYQADMKAMADPITRDWWKLNEPMQVPIRGRKEGEWWASMAMLGHSGGEVKSGGSVRRGALRAQVGRGGESRVRGILEADRVRLLAAIRRHGLQNVSVYSFGGWIYLYYELAGPDDLGGSPILSEDAVAAARRALRMPVSRGSKRPVEPRWESMREVFHTD